MTEEVKKQNTAPEKPVATTPERGQPVNEESLIAALAGELDTESAPKKPKAKKVSTEEAATTSDNKESSDLSRKLDKDAVEPDEDEDTESEESDEGEEEDDDEDTKAEGDDEEPGDTDEDEEDDTQEEVVYTTPDGDEVTLEELKRGYLRQSDYTKKTQEIAESRQKAQELFQTVEQHNNVVAEHLHMALSVLEPQLAQLAATDWDTLASTDAYEYAEKRALFDQAQVRYQRLQQAAQQTVAQAQRQTEIRKQQMLAEEQQKLLMAMPDLADPKVGPKLSRDIKEYALGSVGLTPEEAGNLTDHRLVLVLNKARMYDQLLSAQSAAGKKKLSKSPRRVASSGQPSSKAEIKARATSNARARLKASGSEEDFIAMLMGQ